MKLFCALSALWLFKWWTNRDFSRNVLGQKSHLCGCSPLCIRKWYAKPWLRVNSFPQSSHTNRFSLVWVFKWPTRYDFLRNFLAHKWHSCVFSVLCARKWFIKVVPYALTCSRRLHLLGTSRNNQRRETASVGTTFLEVSSANAASNSSLVFRFFSS